MAMTYKKLKEIIERNGVPEDVHLMSNSGWECSATEMDGVYWNPEANEVHFIQESVSYRITCNNGNQRTLRNP